MDRMRCVFEGTHVKYSRSFHGGTDAVPVDLSPVKAYNGRVRGKPPVPADFAALDPEPARNEDNNYEYEQDPQYDHAVRLL